MPHTEGPDGPIHYQTTGTGEPVVLIPGLGFGHAAWSYQTNALRPHCRVIAIDPRGSGRSIAPPGPYTLQRMAGDVIEVLDALEVATATVVGMSLGGCIAQTLALEFDNRVNRLILISTTSGGAEVVGLCDRLEMLVQTEGLLAAFSDVFAQSYTDRFMSTHADQIARLRANMAQSLPTEAGFLGQLAALRTCHTEPHLGKIRVPTLVIAGTDDPLFATDAARQLAETIPGARLVPVDGAHACTVESADHVNQLLEEFLQEPHAHISL